MYMFSIFLVVILNLSRVIVSDQTESMPHDHKLKNFETISNVCFVFCVSCLAAWNKAP